MDENKRIIVIDDDPGVRNAFEEILAPPPSSDVSARGAALFDEEPSSLPTCSAPSYYLTLVENGEQGINAVETALAQHQPFAVAFIDMRMPGIDGAKTSKRIWEIDPEIKIVIVTAYSEYTPDDIIQVTGRDDIFYLRKPFNPAEIRQFARALTKNWNLEHETELLSRQLEDMNKNLKEKVEEQTALLIQSEKMASMGILVAGVAHEINNPIAFIHGNLASIKKYSSRVRQMLLKYETLETHVSSSQDRNISGLMEEIRQFKKEKKIDFILGDMMDLAEESLDGVVRVGHIIKELKTFSRVDETEMGHVDINATLESTLNIIWNEIKYKADVVKDYGELPEVRCFAQKIGQVFMNILLNSAQAIKEKGTITISTRYVKEGRRMDDSRVEILISDTGSGISKESISKIFDPFFTTKPVGQGTGLGLSITYDIIRSFGGNIKVKSDIGRGTTFTIILPLEPKL